MALSGARTARRRARRRIAARRKRPYTGSADVVRPVAAAVAISRPDPRRKRKLPRSLPGGRRLQPYSRADAPFFRSPGFFVRVGGLAAIVGIALCVLALRAWSIQILHGPAYTALANGQAYRTVDLIGPRGPIVDCERAEAGRYDRARRSSSPMSPRSARSTRRAGSRSTTGLDDSPQALAARAHPGHDVRRAHSPVGRTLAVRAGHRAPAAD